MAGSRQAGHRVGNIPAGRGGSPDEGSAARPLPLEAEDAADQREAKRATSYRCSSRRPAGGAPVPASRRIARPAADGSMYGGDEPWPRSTPSPPSSTCMSGTYRTSSTSTVSTPWRPSTPSPSGARRLHRSRGAHHGRHPEPGGPFRPGRPHRPHHGQRAPHRHVR